MTEGSGAFPHPSRSAAPPWLSGVVWRGREPDGARAAGDLRGRRALLTGYVVVECGLIATSAALAGRSFAGALNIIAVTIGLLAFIVGVGYARPRPMAGWFVVALSAIAQLAAAVWLAAVYGLHGTAAITAGVPAVLVAVSLPLLAGGLAQLGRQGSGAAADILDSAMLAVGGFLLLWAFFISSELDANAPRLAAAFIYPIGALLTITTAFKLSLAGGLRDPAIRLLLLSVVVLLTATIGVLIPAVRADVPTVARPVALIWVGYGALLGAVGLHPRLAERHLHSPAEMAGLSKGRIGLFAALALVAPLALAGELAEVRDTVGRSIAGIAASLAAASVLLLLLVVRLALIARISQRRADELSLRTAALAAAVADQDELQRQLAQRAMHDPLTGLSNRVVLTERLEAVLARRSGSGHHALLLLDLDGFKDINDTLGHPVGDELLIQLSARLVAALSGGALVARLGGDEFAVLLEETDGVTARQAAEAILATVRRPFVIGGRELFLTTSVGLLATDPAKPPLTPSEALRDADLALYAAKAAGKSRVIFFEPHLRAERMDYARISNGLRHALSHDELVLHYQPVIDLTTRRVVAVEALLRWRPPGQPAVDSAEFVAVAEEAGLITPIGAWSLQQACRDAKRWYGEHGVLVSVNIAARQLDDSGFADTVVGALADAGLDGEALVLELTESSLVASVRDDSLNIKLRRLRAMGVRIAVDDFGTGFTSLSYVSSLPVDIVKVDRAFTQHRGSPSSSPETWAFTRAVLELIDGLNLLAVAEGIETPQQEQVLHTLKFPYAQGYLFGRPVPAAGIDEVLDVQVAVPTVP